MATFTAQSAEPSVVSSSGFTPADTFANAVCVVGKNGVEIPLYGRTGVPLHIEAQNDPRAKALLQQIVAKQAAGESVELTIKVIFRGKKAEVVADSSVNLADFI